MASTRKKKRDLEKKRSLEKGGKRRREASSKETASGPEKRTVVGIVKKKDAGWKGTIKNEAFQKRL